MSIIYEPFHIEAKQEPDILSPIEEAADEAVDELTDEVILDRDGIHYINSRVLNPDKDTEKTLDPKFLDLVDSVMKPATPGAP
jgi:hypothetical protein